MRDVLATDELWRQERGAIEQRSRRIYPIRNIGLLASAAQMFAGTPYEHDALGTGRRFKKPPARC